MAMKTVFVFLIMTVVATSVAEALNTMGGIVYVNGTLYCTSDGSRGNNAIAPPVFSGATVQVACSTEDIAISTGNKTTDSNGVYLVVLFPGYNTTLESFLSGCRISILTPLSTCNPTLPSTGLVSNLLFVKKVPSSFWSITYLVASGFTPQP